jgi:hypothetical protein
VADMEDLNLNTKFFGNNNDNNNQQLVDQLVADMEKLNLDTIRPFNPPLDGKNSNWLADQYVRQKFIP